jgi:hypothetical protein
MKNGVEPITYNVDKIVFYLFLSIISLSSNAESVLSKRMLRGKQTSNKRIKLLRLL